MRKLGFLLFVVLMTITMPVNAELLIHYNFDEAEGTTVNDASDNGHTGAFAVRFAGYSPPVIWDSAYKPTLSQLNVSSARLTDNVNTLTTPDSDDIDGLTSFTLMMWVNGNPYNDSTFPVMAWKDDEYEEEAHAGFKAWWDIGVGTLNLLVGGESDNPVTVVDSDRVGSLNGWHHWAVTYDGTNMTNDDTHFYLDGELIGSDAIHQSTVLTNDLDLYISCRPDQAYAQRQLSDEFRLYGSVTDSSGALSQEEIQLAMTSPALTCAGILESGAGLAGDLNFDCHVNLLDVDMMAPEWLTINMPTSDDPCMTYYGFLDIDVNEYAIQTYQQARVNSAVMAVGEVNPEVYKIMRKFGQAGIGVVPNWSYIFETYPGDQWESEIANVKNLLDAQDVTKYIVLNNVIDEPQVASNVTNIMVAFIKSAFPDVPTCINWGSDFDTSGRVTGTTADVVGFDYYVWPNETAQTDVDYFNGRLDPKIAAMKTLAPGKPIVLTGQSSPYPDDYHPTTDQMRMYADKAIADSDIQGLLYWAWCLGDFDQNDIDMFKSIGSDASLPLCSRKLLIDQGYEGAAGVSDWNLIMDPWNYGEGMMYYTASESYDVYHGIFAWHVIYLDQSSSVDRRSYNVMDDVVTQDDDFSITFYAKSLNKGNADTDIGYIGLYDTGSSLTHNPFVGINLGSPSPDRDLSLMMQINMDGGSYTSDPNACIVEDNMYYGVKIDYTASSRVFDYTVIDPNGTVVLTDLYVLPVGEIFTLDSFGVSDSPDADSDETIAMAIDFSAVNIVLPDVASCQAVWTHGLGMNSDLNQDCFINFKDFAVLAGKWLMCNDPVDSGCQ